MKKRIVAALLWFCVGWYAWSILAWVTGLPELAGPIIGTALAAFFAGDPLGRFWLETRARSALVGPTPPAISPTQTAEPA